MENKLNFVETLKGALNLAIANMGSLVVMILLYVLTIWIPYLNIGTTIGLIKAIAAIGRGETVNATDIFKKENFKSFSDFFVLLAIEFGGVGAAAIFMLVPAIVLGIAWGYAPYFLVDKGTAPVKSLSLSYKVTVGEKWTIFFLTLVLGLAISIVSCILGLIPYLGGILVMIVSIFGSLVSICLEAKLYAHFLQKAVDMGEIEAPVVVAAPEAPAAPETPETPTEA